MKATIVRSQNAMPSLQLHLYRPVIDHVRKRIQWLSTKAHIDLLEVVVLKALFDLAGSLFQIISAEVQQPLYHRMWNICPPVVWVTLVTCLAIIELVSILVNDERARQRVQFISCLVFMAVGTSILLSAAYALVWKDYLTFALCAAGSSYRLHCQIKTQSARLRKKERCSILTKGQK